MSDSHDEWLKEQGARVIEKRSLRRVSDKIPIGLDNILCYNILC